MVVRITTEEKKIAFRKRFRNVKCILYCTICNNLWLLASNVPGTVVPHYMKVGILIISELYSILKSKIFRRPVKHL